MNIYPRLTIHLDKLIENAKYLTDFAEASGVTVYVVTKVFAADERILRALSESGIRHFADARLENIARMDGLDVEKMLLRLPMQTQAAAVVEKVDVSLNSEMTTIRALNDAAVRQGKRHRILLMVDLGDLREGVLPEHLMGYVKEILDLSNIELDGIGTNLTCYGGVIPDSENLGTLWHLAKTIESTFNIRLKTVSGGNSSSFYLLEEGILPKGINQLRFGEAVVLGRETAFGNAIEGMHDDAFILEAEIIELKEKGSIPVGTIGMDAFGNKPVFEDKGQRLRAILAIGRQDVDPSGLLPLDSALQILGASSDHLIVDVTHSQHAYAVGGTMRFKVDYAALLSLITSQFVKRYYL